MYYFYLDNVLLPVTPSKLSIKTKNQNKTVNLVDGSEYNIIRTPGLTEISFDALLPNAKYPFGVYENDIFQNADYFLEKLENLKVNQSSFTFRVIRKDDLNSTEIDVTIEDYTITESSDYGFDYMVSLKLKQYSLKETKIVTLSSDSTTATTETERATTDATPETLSYTIKSGDTLYTLAKRYLGDGAKYTEIYSANQETIENAAKSHGYASSSNGHLIFPGTVITIANAIV